MQVPKTTATRVLTRLDLYPQLNGILHQPAGVLARKRDYQSLRAAIAAEVLAELLPTTHRWPSLYSRSHTKLDQTAIRALFSVYM